ncbi:MULTISPECIES: helix-turn-helix domain-containing protein [unclassified Paenibacillus]|uniref:response regulator transcription factor n=1 Tax=unclassified Paenibacillus TaxID=185978 RepID=UPI001050BBBA|nr:MULTISPECIES: helix-turn-helix domain-containing protein [unclassified Paenibacillus]NIK68283.1 two-component system response regulator YesN [Paenibacillus sp. BK720]TCM99502.1 two-component system response regulator YesN [Paenibacillus sp. BK033]
MYKVMLVDDDYPVIELLSEVVDWEKLGLVLSGKHENGLAAWEHVQEEIPDILVTDIGMPKMDGLELAQRVKKLNPSVRIVILSCHSEFQYAQQAMRLDVQDYLLKDQLDPEELIGLLQKFKEGFDGERQMLSEQNKMKRMVSETQDLRKEKLFREFVQQPLISAEQWQRDFGSYGLFQPGELCLPAAGFIENYNLIKNRFDSDQTLHFAISNVMEELLAELPLRVVHIGYSSRQSLLLFAFKPGLKQNVYDQVQSSLQTVQRTLGQVLKIQMAFLIGTGCDNPQLLKQALCNLLKADEQRFYLSKGETAKWQKGAQSGSGLLALYDQAAAEIREAIMAKDGDKVRTLAGKWETHIRKERYASEEVRDWVLKLLIDMRLKLHAMLFASQTLTAEKLHKEIVYFDSLWGLFEWFHTQLQSYIAAREEALPVSKRREVSEACKYVSMNLGKRISLEEVAAHLHMNPSYFSRFFKKETGLTFIEYVTDQKIERAKELLDQTNYYVSEICEMLGYDNQSYFIKTFKAQTGLTPTEYRG